MNDQNASAELLNRRVGLDTYQRTYRLADGHHLLIVGEYYQQGFTTGNCAFGELQSNICDNSEPHPSDGWVMLMSENRIVAHIEYCYPGLIAVCRANGIVL